MKPRSSNPQPECSPTDRFTLWDFVGYGCLFLFCLFALLGASFLAA